MQKLNNIIDIKTILFLIISSIICLLTKRHIDNKKSYNNDLYLIQEDFSKHNYEDVLIGNENHIGIYEMLLKSNKKIDTLNLYAGICLTKLNSFTQAIKYLKNVNINDKLINIKINTLLGDCHVEVKDFENANKYYIKALELSQDSPELYTNIIFKIVLIYENQKKYKEAHDIIKDTLRKFKGEKAIEKLKEEKEKLKLYI